MNCRQDTAIALRSRRITDPVIRSAGPPFSNAGLAAVIGGLAAVIGGLAAVIGRLVIVTAGLVIVTAGLVIVNAGLVALNAGLVAVIAGLVVVNAGLAVQIAGLVVLEPRPMTQIALLALRFALLERPTRDRGDSSWVPSKRNAHLPLTIAPSTRLIGQSIRRSREPAERIALLIRQSALLIRQSALLDPLKRLPSGSIALGGGPGRPPADHFHGSSGHDWLAAPISARRGPPSDVEAGAAGAGHHADPASPPGAPELSGSATLGSSDVERLLARRSSRRRSFSSCFFFLFKSFWRLSNE